MASLPITPLTEDQYLQIERAALDKSEFHDGQMFAMSGGSLNHALLAVAMGAMLMTGRCLRDAVVIDSQLRIKTPGGLYTYPDCSVLCGEAPVCSAINQDVLLNPLLIVEVLSPSTEGYDRGRKFALYRAIESFQEYLIVHQDRRYVEHYSRLDDGSWLLREHNGRADRRSSIPRLNVNYHSPWRYLRLHGRHGLICPLFRDERPSVKL